MCCWVLPVIADMHKKNLTTYPIFVIFLSLAACSSGERQLPASEKERIAFAEQFGKTKTVTADQSRRCLLLSNIAESMMHAHQSGVSLEQTQRTWSSERFLYPLINRAYSQPRESTKEARVERTREFALSSLEECLTGFQRK